MPESKDKPIIKRARRLHGNPVSGRISKEEWDKLSEEERAARKGKSYKSKREILHPTTDKPPRSTAVQHMFEHKAKLRALRANAKRKRIADK